MTFGQKLAFAALIKGSNLLARLGFARLSRLGAWLGQVMWLMLPARRAMARANVAGCLGLGPERAAQIAQSSFRHAGRSFAEILLTPEFGLRSPNLRFAQPDLYRAFQACPRPIVAATAHIGAWELMASLLGELHAAPRPRLMVARRYANPVAQAFIARQREARGAVMVGHRTVAASVLQALRDNGVVAFLVDHNAKPSEAVNLPFLGKEAAVNMGPALLAVRAEALIWPVFLLRGGDDYILHLEEPLDTADLSGDRQEKVRRAVEFYTGHVEKMVLRCPEQWFWLHNRWKRRSGP